MFTFCDSMNKKNPTLTVNSESRCGLDVATYASVDIAVLRFGIENPQFDQLVSVPDVVLLSI